MRLHPHDLGRWRANAASGPVGRPSRPSPLILSQCTGHFTSSFPWRGGCCQAGLEAQPRDLVVFKCSPGSRQSAGESGLDFGDRAQRHGLTAGTYFRRLAAVVPGIVLHPKGRHNGQRCTRRLSIGLEFHGLLGAFFLSGLTDEEDLPKCDTCKNEYRGPWRLTRYLQPAVGEAAAYGREPAPERKT